MGFFLLHAQRKREVVLCLHYKNPIKKSKVRNEYKGRDGPFVFNTLLSLFIYAPLTEVKGAIFTRRMKIRYLRVMLFAFG